MFEDQRNSCQFSYLAKANFEPSKMKLFLVVGNIWFLYWHQPCVPLYTLDPFRLKALAQDFVRSEGILRIKILSETTEVQ